MYEVWLSHTKRYSSRYTEDEKRELASIIVSGNETTAANIVVENKTEKQ